MPGLGSFVGEFERALPQIGAAEGGLLAPQETVRYDVPDRNGASLGELRVLLTQTQLAQGLEFIAAAPMPLDRIATLAQAYLPPDAAVRDEVYGDTDDHLLRHLLSASLADSHDLAPFTTSSADGDPPDPGTLTLELTPTRWLIRPGRWPFALPDA